jgi:hypothetical protein
MGSPDMGKSCITASSTKVDDLNSIIPIQYLGPQPCPRICEDIMWRALIIPLCGPDWLLFVPNFLDSWYSARIRVEPVPNSGFLASTYSGVRQCGQNSGWNNRKPIPWNAEHVLKVPPWKSFKQWALLRFFRIGPAAATLPRKSIFFTPNVTFVVFKLTQTACSLEKKKLLSCKRRSSLVPE